MLNNGHKERHRIGSYEDLGYAKHVCNCYMHGPYDYTYFKFRDTTIYYLRMPDDYYDARPVPTGPKV
ncbi:MAG: hypothetical protein JNM37_09335 [Rhodocyclaceae bacterium]|nr:hypothetical protein [Rhodocyclaceae bacterium]